jgi:hypothetical protein
MKLFICVCIAVLAASAFAEVSDVPADEFQMSFNEFPGEARSAPLASEDMELLDSSFEDAKTHITELLAAGKNDQACRDLAAASKKTVTDSVAANQKAVAGMPNGDQCAGEGADLVKTAEANKVKADDAEKDALNKVNAAEAVKINFGDMVVSSLKEGQCANFYNSLVYTNAKKKIKEAKDTYQKKVAEAKAAAKAVTTAKEEAAKLVRKCKCDSKKAIEKAIKDFNDKAAATNKAAWTKSYHMICVVEGKTAAQCSVPTVPTVQPVPFGAGVKSACACGYPIAYKNINSKTGGRDGPHQTFQLIKMSKCSGYSDDAAGMKKYEDECLAFGFKAVGCGTDQFDSSQNANSIAMPKNWGCNMLSIVKSTTGWGNDIVTLQEKLGNSAALYTPTNHPQSSWNLHAVCGKKGHAAPTPPPTPPPTPAPTPLTCTTMTKTNGGSGGGSTLAKAGYTVTGCAIQNKEGGYDAKSGVEAYAPSGNDKCGCDSGFGSGKNNCFATVCKRGQGLDCVTKSCRVNRKGHSCTASLPTGYTMTGGGLINHYRTWDKHAQFERSQPSGNGWLSDMGFGWGDFTSYVRGCKGLTCKTVSQGVADAPSAKCPSGYTLTGCGMRNGYTKFDKLAKFEYVIPNSDTNVCKCNLGAGTGKTTCFARCCKNA